MAAVSGPWEACLGGSGTTGWQTIVEFRVLGPLEVQADGHRIQLGGRKQRALLAVLLLNANEVVSRDRLIDALWGERPPPTASHTLDAYVSRLRRALAGDGDGDGGARLVTLAPGYVLRLAPDQLDLARFERLGVTASVRLMRGNPTSRSKPDCIHRRIEPRGSSGHRN
jgi:DNA-binding SARP family transcriptional activator